MSFSNAQLAIEQRFSANFTALTHIKYENTDFNPDELPENTSFAEIRVIDSDSRRAEVGAGPALHRSFGIISVNIYTPKNIGTKTGRTHADTAAAVFRDAQFSGITCRSPLVRNVGEREGWYVVNMTCPFQRDEIL